MPKKPKIRKPGTVRRIIRSPYPKEPEKAEIVVKGAEPLYREIRVENTLEGEKGKEYKLKEGAEVEVTVEADPEETVPKSKSDL